MASKRWGDGATKRGEPIVLTTVLGNEVQQRLHGVLELGALVGLSLSRDGGALSVAITFDGVTEREWFRDEPEVILWLDEATGMLEDAVREAASRDTRPRRGRGR